MANNNVSQPVSESMSLQDISEAQATHYTLDDQIRRKLGVLSIDQKKQVSDLILKLTEKR